MGAECPGAMWLGAFFGVRGIELNGIALLERLVAVELQRAVMHEGGGGAFGASKPYLFAVLSQRTVPAYCALCLSRS
jgi:hypothetical protein